MPVTKTIKLLATSFCLMFGTALYAQEAAAPAADPVPHDTTTDSTATDGAKTGAAPGVDGLSMGREADAAPAADAIGTTYIAEKFEAWEQRCVRTADGADPCQLYQLLLDADKNPVAEISVFGLPRPAGRRWRHHHRAPGNAADRRTDDGCRQLEAAQIPVLVVLTDRVFRARRLHPGRGRGIRERQHGDADHRANGCPGPESLGQCFADRLYQRLCSGQQSQRQLSLRLSTEQIRRALIGAASCGVTAL